MRNDVVFLAMWGWAWNLLQWQTTTTGTCHRPPRQATITSPHPRRRPHRAPPPSSRLPHQAATTTFTSSTSASSKEPRKRSRGSRVVKRYLLERKGRVVKVDLQNLKSKPCLLNVKIIVVIGAWCIWYLKKSSTQTRTTNFTKTFNHETVKD